MATFRGSSEANLSGSSHPWSPNGFSRLFSSFNALLEVPNQLGQGRADGRAPVPQLDEVESALTAFDITDEGLRAS